MAKQGTRFLFLCLIWLTAPAWAAPTIQVTTTPAAPMAGQDLTIHISVTAEQLIEVLDVLPAGFAFISVSSASCSHKVGLIPNLNDSGILQRGPTRAGQQLYVVQGYTPRHLEDQDSRSNGSGRYAHRYRSRCMDHLQAGIAP